MTALATDRQTPARTGDTYSYPVAASVTCYIGALAMLDASGNVKPGAAATGQIACGVFTERVTNGATAAAVNVTVRPGIFRFANSAAGDAIAKAAIGDDCYIVDDQTVAATNGSSTRSVAGKILDVDADGVWVRVGI
jgi:hypothetical protein